jgi:hypothetical protein
MSTNGNGRTIAELVAAVEADIAREKREEETAHRMALEAQLAAVNEKLEKLTAPPPLRRSKLTAREKSDLITQIGGEAYLALPW